MTNDNNCNKKTYIYKDFIPNIEHYFTVIGIILSVIFIILGTLTIFDPQISSSDSNNNQYIKNILKDNLGSKPPNTSIQTNFINVLNIIITDFSKGIKYDTFKQDNIFLKYYSYIKAPIITSITSIILLFNIVQFGVSNINEISKKSIIVILRITAILLWLLIFFTVIYIIIYISSILFIGYFYDTTIESHGMNLILPFIFIIIIMILRKYRMIQDITTSKDIELPEWTNNRVQGGGGVVRRAGGRRRLKKNK